MGNDSVDMSQGEVPSFVKDRETGEIRPNPDFPADRSCKSGHIAPHGVRFFAVSGRTLPAERWGLYCELCLTVSNKHAAMQRKGKGEGFNFAAELNVLVKKAEREHGN